MGIVALRQTIFKVLGIEIGEFVASLPIKQTESSGLVCVGLLLKSVWTGVSFQDRAESNAVDGDGFGTVRMRRMCIPAGGRKNSGATESFSPGATGGGSAVF